MSLVLARRAVLQAATGGAFDPASLSPLLRLKASSITGLVNGDPVATWPDVSGNARHATQATAAKRPTWVTGVLNGKAVVRFDDVDDGMVTGLTQTSDFSAWIVYNYRQAAAAPRRALAGGPTGANNWLMGPYQNKHQAFNGDFLPTPPSVVQGVFVEHVMTQSATVAEHFVANVSYGTRAAAPTWPGELGVGAVGVENVEPLGGDVAEVIVVAGVLSAADRANLHDYAFAEYSI